MSLVEPKAHVMEIVPYIAGEAKLPGFDHPAKLSSNESPLGPCPAAIEAFLGSADELERYPDGSSTDLREAISGHHGLTVGQVVCGNGSEQLIDAICRAYAGPGDEVICTEYAFIMYLVSTLACGAALIRVPETDYVADVDALLASVTERTKIVFLANPNNPTGTHIGPRRLRRLREGLPEHVLLVVDAAYSEYIDRLDYSDGSDLVGVETGNTVVLRTFSKIYGLAALRVGWAQCPEDIALVVHRVRGVFNINTPAQRAAIAALGDTEFLARAKAHNDKWLAWMSDEISNLGLEVIPSVANFVLIHFDSAGQCKAADEALRQEGIILRPVANYGLPQCLRASVGLEQENLAVVDVLRRFLA